MANAGMKHLGKVLQASQRFKASLGHEGKSEKISVATRELIRKITDNRTFLHSRERCLKELVQCVGALFVNASADIASETVNEAMASMQGIVEGWASDCIHICFESWDVEHHSSKLEAALARNVRMDKDRSDAHKGYLQELMLLKEKIHSLQNCPNFDVAISNDDVVFYEATEYLEDHQRELVKDIVVYKVKAELAKKAGQDASLENVPALKKQIRSQEERIKELEKELIQERDKPARKRTMSSFNFNDRIEEETPPPTTPPVPRRRTLAVTEEEPKEEKKPPPKFTVDKASNTDPPKPEPKPAPNKVATVNTASNTDPPKQESKPKTPPSPPKVKMVTKSTNTDPPKPATPPEPKSLLQELVKTVECIEKKPEPVKEKPPKTIVVTKEVIKEPEPAPVVEKPVPKSPSPSPLERVLVEKVQEEKARQPYKGGTSPDELIDALRLEMEKLRKLCKDSTAVGASADRMDEIIDLLEKREKQPPEVTTKIKTVVDDSLLQEKDSLLKAKNEKIRDLKEKNKQLEIALSELQEKLKHAQRKLREAGLGDAADQIFKDVGLNNVLKFKPCNVFDRLYMDALTRLRKSDEVKNVTKCEHAEALLSTIQTIYGEGEEPRPPTPPLSPAGMMNRRGTVRKPSIIVPRRSVLSEADIVFPDQELSPPIHRLAQRHPGEDPEVMSLLQRQPTTTSRKLSTTVMNGYSAPVPQGVDHVRGTSICEVPIGLATIGVPETFIREGNQDMSTIQVGEHANPLIISGVMGSRSSSSPGTITYASQEAKRGSSSPDPTMALRSPGSPNVGMFSSSASFHSSPGTSATNFFNNSNGFHGRRDTTSSTAIANRDPFVRNSVTSTINLSTMMSEPMLSSAGSKVMAFCSDDFRRAKRNSKLHRPHASFLQTGGLAATHPAPKHSVSHSPPPRFVVRGENQASPMHLDCTIP